MTDNRLKREAEFHDKVFADESRVCTDKFYSIADSSRNFYRDYVISHCAQKQVLEYGCGQNSLVTRTIPKGAIVTAIDISEVAMHQHRDLVRRKQLDQSRAHSCVMNAESLGFADRSFDLVCGSGIIHHLHIRASLCEVSRVMKPGATAVFLEPLGHNPIINAYRNRTPELRSVDEHPILMNDLEVAREYFGKVEVTYFHLTSLAAVAFHQAPWFKRVTAWFDGLDRILFRALPPVRKHAWAAGIVLAEPVKVATGQVAVLDRVASC